VPIKTSAAGAAPVRRGRPRKFTVPSRPVTVTLPERVLTALASIDGDLGRAIVRLAQPALGKQPHAPAELATFGRHSVIVVNPSRTLEQRTGVELIHLPDGRALISFDQTRTIPALELMIKDALEDPDLPAGDRDIFDAIADILKTARRSDRVALLQRNVIVLETRKPLKKRTTYVKNRVLALVGVPMMAAVIGACGDSKPTPPTTPAPLPATLTAPKVDAPSSGSQLDTLRPTLTVQNVTSDQPNGSRTYEFQVSDTTAFSAATTQSISGFNATVSKTGVAEGTGGKTSFAVESDLQPTTMFYWRARAIQGSVTGPWSDTFQFKSKLVGYCRADELYDPLIFGDRLDCVQFIGSTAFVPGKGLKLLNGQSFVRYQLPATITSGEFSVDVEGFTPGYPGDKGKVFGMDNGQGDFITNPYRVDIQYRGNTGVPPGAITFRALYGSADDLNVRYEPDSNKRIESSAEGSRMNPAFTYYWKATWGPEFRVVVKDGGMNATGINGRTIYNYGVASLKGRYNPTPHIAYLGAPVGRSGTESAAIPNLTYRNLYIGARPRPDTLGSALR